MKNPDIEKINLLLDEIRKEVNDKSYNALRLDCIKLMANSAVKIANHISNDSIDSVFIEIEFLKEEIKLLKEKYFKLTFPSGGFHSVR